MCGPQNIKSESYCRFSPKVHIRIRIRICNNMISWICSQSMAAVSHPICYNLLKSVSLFWGFCVITRIWPKIVHWFVVLFLIRPIKQQTYNIMWKISRNNSHLKLRCLFKKIQIRRNRIHISPHPQLFLCKRSAVSPRIQNILQICVRRWTRPHPHISEHRITNRK